MNIKQLTWQSLLPDENSYHELLQTASSLPATGTDAVQARLQESLSLFSHPAAKRRFILVKSDESECYLNTIAQLLPPDARAQQKRTAGGEYHFDNHRFIFTPADNGHFSATRPFAVCDWIEPEQLFGQVFTHHQHVQLQPGLIHQINGGYLIISMRSLLAQPLMWLRLKQMVCAQRFEWLAHTEQQPLPFPVDGMPLDLRVILTGDRMSLDEFMLTEPELSEEALYGEYEFDCQIEDIEQLTVWCQFINGLLKENQLPSLSPDGWYELIRQGMRHQEDKKRLPLDLLWLTSLLRDAATLLPSETITAEALRKIQENRLWRHGYLADRGLDEILQGQVYIQTQGSTVGQINGLSVLQYPGHPQAVGEPSRITCVAHIGDGEFVDVERKSELGGNIHAKGMMIMQAYLIAELKLDQPFPFSTSVVFEQSYGEVDGDSASLAELCALISALSWQPVDQQIAVTGSVDQFGFVQAIGGVNEKIEGFFRLCQSRGLTGEQGVIIPASNERHLVLSDDVVDAVRAGEFRICTASHVSQAASHLMKMPYYEEENNPSGEHLLAIIQDRIFLANNQDKPRAPWFSRWWK
ncbi:AAA family ATPase [Morganella psychrotolerans]|uniref:endopeptidase La n=1 Tax=Morganella psychrotolerans TaxID=368603 RepID=A0A1B8H502_9GAMM|nr:Lon protease family protein [Morganella psychrotolerans]OBU04150.1 Lon protease [Morganella psychrotolerans]